VRVLFIAGHITLAQIHDKRNIQTARTGPRHITIAPVTTLTTKVIVEKNIVIVPVTSVIAVDANIRGKRNMQPIISPRSPP